MPFSILPIGLFIVLNNKSKETNPFINSNIEVKTFQIENDWGYFDDFFITRRLRSKHNIFLRRTVKITEPMRVGTCSIVHLRDLPVKWEDGYGHDHEFVKKLKIYPHKRMGVGEYYVCHIPIYDKYEDMEYDLDNRDYIIRY